MKKALKIVLQVICVFSILIGSLVLWQTENLQALHIAMTYNTDEILSQMQENDAALKKEITPYFSGGIREFTPEEQAQIDKGEVTEKQMLAKVITETTPPETPNPTPEQTKQQKTEAIISNYVSALYTMEAEYLGRIEGLLSSAISEYKAKRTGTNNRSLQLSIGAAYTGKLTALEAECDGKVSALLSQMESELTAIGSDTTIVNTIRSAYAGEKTTKRAYYMSKYGIN